MKTACLLLALIASTLTFTFSPQQPSPSYNVTTSQEIVKFAAVAFCGPTCVNQWNCGTTKGIKMTDSFYFEHPLTKAAGFVGYLTTTNQIVLSFRGTSNAQNWIQDANFEKITYFRCLRCQMHAGFYADYLLLQQQLTAKVKALLTKNPSASILTTGHSLGAAIAAIAAIELKSIFPSTKVVIHNYGQPRLGNVELAKHMSQKLDGIYRVVHNKDIVPHVPPDLPGFQYHHPGYEVFWNSDMTVYKVCNESGEDKSCSNKFFPEYDPNDHDHYFLYISQVQC